MSRGAPQHAGGFDVKGFKQQVARIGKSIRAIADEWVGLTVAFAFYEIKFRTPIDTGELRAAWGYSDRLAIARAGQAPSPKLIRAGRAHVISNTVVYGPVVEYGLYPGVGRSQPPKTVAFGDGIYSTQAPGGMMRLGLIAAGVRSEGFASDVIRRHGW